MPGPRSDASFTTHFALLNKAIDPKHARGFRTQPMPYGAAVHLRQRCYMARAKEAETNKRSYPAEHPLYGRTRWDSVVISIDPPRKPEGPNPLASLVFANGATVDLTDLKLFDHEGKEIT